MNLIVALLYAVASSVLLGLMLGFQNGSLDTQIAVLSLAGGAIFGFFGWWRSRSDPALPRPQGWGWLPVVIFALFSLRAFLWLIFLEGDDVRVLSPNNLGDMSLHLTFIHYFANGAPLWPDSPIFSAGKLTYSAGMDIFNSLLVLAGVDVVRGLVWAGLLGALATGFALWRWGGAFTLMGFLCSGGLVGFACMAGGPEQPFFQDYQAEWAWKSLPLAILVTQRGFLFALPAGLLLLSSWRTRFFLDGEGWRMPFAGELLLYAAMPAFHLHTFIALSFMLAVFFIVRAPARVRIARLVGAAFVPATLLVYLTVGMLKTNAEPMRQELSSLANPPPRPPIEALGWQPGWMVNDDATTSAWNAFAADSPVAASFPAHGRFLIFWLGNFGLLPLLLVPLALALFPGSVRPLHAWLLLAAAVLLTPLLGGWDAYQRESLGALLGGPGPHARLRGSLPAMLAIATLVIAFILHRRNAGDHGLRRVLFAFAGIVVTDGLFAGLHAWNHHVPLLRANAIPLLLGTFLFAVVLWRLGRSGKGSQWPAAFVFPALYLFFLCCNVKFATWDWDNTKLMIWAYLMVLPFLWDLLIVRWNPMVRAAICILLFFSGFVSLVGGIDGRHSGHPIAERSKLDGVREAVRGIPITATFAAQPTYNHPLLLCGRKLVMGYEGHLGSHGIRYEATHDELSALMTGDPDWRSLAARLGARYLFFGSGELQEWPASSQPWRSEAKLVASGEWGELFDLEAPSLPRDDFSQPPTPTLR